jgi:hypothetical protein
VDIGTADILDGGMPRRAEALVKEWATAHRDELRRVWDLARAAQPLDAIDPLD